MNLSRAAELMSQAAGALTRGDIDSATMLTEQAFTAEPRLRKAVEKMKPPETIADLMPLLRRKAEAGPVLRRIRQTLGLSQVQVAEICGVAQHYIAGVETGRQSMAEEPMRRLIEWGAARGATIMGEQATTDALVKLRKLLRMSPYALADKLGVKEMVVRRIEANAMPVPVILLEKYRRLAAERGIDFDRLAA
jgi:transcriptional regulator with XRE-family HTH domain